MEDLQVFKSTDFGELGVLVIDGKEYFPAVQCAKVLGYSNPRDAVKRHCKTDGVVKHDGVSYTTNQHGVTTQQVTEIKYINEGNLYRLIVSSRLPSAEKFERWVFDEVLPTIRRTGGYGGADDIQDLIAKTATAVVSEVVKQLVPVLTKSVSQAEPVIEEIWEEPHKRVRYKSHSIISHLDKDLRDEVDDMLMSEKFTLEEVKDFLAGYGIRISTSSIHRYCKRLYSI